MTLEKTLSADESQRAARFHFQADKERFIAAHGCLRDILARYLHWKPDQLSFSTNSYGKPALPGHKLEFNLSHSGDFALVAVARGHRVGADIERIREGMSTVDIAQRYFSKQEVSELMSLPPVQREVAFFNCWTRKEAYIKANGLGLYLPLDSFDVSLVPGEPAILRATRPDPQEVARWTLKHLEVRPDYSAALAVEGAALSLSKGRDLEFRLWEWTFEIR